MTSNQAVAPAFSPPPVNKPKGTWYEHADKVYRFFGFIVDQVSSTTRQVRGCAGQRLDMAGQTSARWFAPCSRLFPASCHSGANQH